MRWFFLPCDSVYYVVCFWIDVFDSLAVIETDASEQAVGKKMGESRLCLASPFIRWHAPLRLP